MKKGAEVAGNYLVGLDEGITDQLWQRMYLFQATGKDLSYEETVEAHRCFESMVTQFAEPNRELDAWITYYRSRLRWCCQARAQSEFPRFLRSAKWFFVNRGFGVPKAKLLGRISSMA